MKPIQIFSVLIILMMATFSFADTVTLKSGDVLISEVQTPYIGLHTEYQNLFFKKDFVLSMMSQSDGSGQYMIKTINNDLFTGALINNQIEAVLDAGSTALFASDTLKGLYLDAPGTTYELDTTIFVMNNGDRFSGQLLTSQLIISTGQLSVPIPLADMERIEFPEPGFKRVNIYLTDGSLLSGELAEDVFGIAPDSVPKINVCVTQFKKIQFNAVKYVKKSITLDTYTDAESGQLEFASLFPEIPTDITNEGAACRKADTAEKPDVSDEKPDEKTDENIEELKLSNVLFDFDQTDIKPEYLKLLDKVVDVLANTPSMKVQIKGHTDIVGTDDYNQSLSAKRALEVAQYFIDAGIITDRISINGYGFTLPIADNNTEQGKALNRRVEILLID